MAMDDGQSQGVVFVERSAAAAKVGVCTALGLAPPPSRPPRQTPLN